MFGAIVLQVVLIFLNAVFASAEIAVLSTSETKINKLAEEGDKRARRLSKLTANSSKFLSTIQVAITLAALLGSAFAADSFSAPLTDLIVNGFGIDPSLWETVDALCVIIVTLVLSFFSIVFGELVPKRLAMRNAEKMALGLSGLLSFVSVFFAPLVWLLTVSTNLVLRIFGIKPGDNEEQVTEEEIMLMAEAGSESGTIDEKENEFIQNVFDFKENTVGEVCTHRKDADILFMQDSDEQWAETVYESRHTYYPVCGKDVDDVIGVLNTKSYFRLQDKSRDAVLKGAVEPAVFVAESMQADSLFYKMKNTREYVAIVVDEYGGMSGIVTIHDLIELLVGDLTEKDEELDYEITKVDENKWEIVGQAPVDDALEALDVTLSEEEIEDCETLGGYVCGLLGAIPDDGATATAETDRFIFTVLEVEDHRIEKLLVEVKPQESESEE